MAKPYYDWDDEKGVYYENGCIDQDPDNHPDTCPAGSSYHGPWFFADWEGQENELQLPKVEECPICCGTNWGLAIPFKDLGF